MSAAAFTWGGYRDLLAALKQGRYAFRDYQGAERGTATVILRHDVDKDLAAAVAMAELERREDVRATYFFLLRSPLYGLLEPHGARAVRRISELGHAVGLHCDERRMAEAQGDGLAFDAAVARERRAFEAVTACIASPVVSLHNPSPGLFGRVPERGEYVSAYAPEFTPPAMKYLSDSNGAWREGDPCERLREATWPRLQLLVHPIWWARDHQEEPSAVLRGVFDRRNAEVDEYLRYTNDLWTKARPASRADPAEGRS